MEIIQAQAADEIEAVRAIFREYQQFLGVDLSFQGFEEELATLPGCYAPPKGQLLLARDGAHAAGCVALRPLEDGACEMKRLFVRPAYRGRGLGRLLATRIVSEATALGYALMRLDTLETLDDAMHLYSSLGFRRRPSYYANPLPGVVYWERALSNRTPASVADGSGHSPHAPVEAPPMKTLGLLGGMSWESTIPYYRIINETVRERLGGLHSARLILYNVDFHAIERLQQAGAWDDAGRILADAARSLEAAGAEGLTLCTNTMHKVAVAIEAAVTIPLLHIADPTAAAVKQAGLGTVGLLGTRFTMEQDFYRSRLTAQHGLTVIVPGPADREIVHRVIYEELCQGAIRAESRAHYREIMQRLVEAGAEGLILGCTEIALLVGPDDAPVPLFDTTDLHARAAAAWALGNAGTPPAAPQ